MVRRGDDDEGDYDDPKKPRSSTPPPITEVGDNDPPETLTPVLISSFIAERFQQEVGDTPSELVLPPNSIAVYASDGNHDAGDASDLGAAAPATPPRQPTPEEMERYALVGHRLNEMAVQIESEYSNELDRLVEDLNLVSTVAYDAFAAVARGIIANGITWSRVLVIILFGWRVMKKVYFKLNSGGGILQTILDYILRFITDHVLQWICARGGWGDLFRNPPGATDGPTGSLNVAPSLAEGRYLGAAAAAFLAVCLITIYCWKK